MQEIFRLFGIRHKTTTAYNPKADGLTERMNGVFKKAISHYTQVNHRNWDDVIPSITLCLNSMRHGTTLYSPFQLLYDRDPNNPVDSALAFNGFEAIENPRAYGQLITKWLNQARKVAQIRTNQTHDKEAPSFNDRRLDAGFEVVTLCSSKRPLI